MHHHLYTGLYRHSWWRRGHSDYQGLRLWWLPCISKSHRDCVQRSLSPGRQMQPEWADNRLAIRRILPWVTLLLRNYSNPSSSSIAMNCPENSHYKTCAEDCSPNCGDISGTACTATADCSEGCQCDPGFVFIDNQCERQKECGCEDPQTGAFIPVCFLA
jgi:hypothetical protein